MHDCGLLGRMFPEFQTISWRVVRDFYHRYTVDEHTLLTIRNLERLSATDVPERQRFRNVLNELPAPELVVLALLFHDVGKWRDDDHDVESERMAQPRARRGCAWRGEARAAVLFLIRHHLKMSLVAFRRDTEDPDIVRNFAVVHRDREPPEDAVPDDAGRRAGGQPGHADPVEGRAAVAALRGHLQPPDPALRRRADRDQTRSSCSGLLSRLPPTCRQARPDTVPRGPAAPLPAALRVRRHLPARAAGARSQRRRRARVAGPDRVRRVDARGRHARSSGALLEHLRRAVLVRHEHHPRPRLHEPERAGAGRVPVHGRRAVPGAEPRRARPDGRRDRGRRGGPRRRRGPAARPRARHPAAEGRRRVPAGGARRQRRVQPLHHPRHRRDQRRRAAVPHQPRDRRRTTATWSWCSSPPRARRRSTSFT